MKRKSTILIALFFLFSIPSFAQFGMGKPEDIQEMKKRTLLVILQPENPDIVKKLEKKHPELMDEYKQSIQGYNDDLQKAFTTNWIYPDQKIEFKTWDKVNALIDAKSKDYAVILVYQKKYGTTEDGFVPFLDWNYKMLIKGIPDEEDKNFYKTSTFMRLTLIEKFSKFNPIAMSGLSNIYPNQADFVGGIYYMKYYLKFREQDKGGDTNSNVQVVSPKLKTQTLLIRQSDLGKDVTTESITAIYHYKFQVVTDSAFDAQVINKTPSYAFIISVPSYVVGQLLFTQVVYSCETGDYLGSVTQDIKTNYGPSNGIKLQDPYGPNSQRFQVGGKIGRITAKELKELAAGMGKN